MGRHTRSRDGCVRCREKKLKCDETKPRCRQCQLRFVPCPGYRMDVRWSTKHEHLTSNGRREGPSQRTLPIQSLGDEDTTPGVPSPHSDPTNDLCHDHDIDMGASCQPEDSAGSLLLEKLPRISNKATPNYNDSGLYPQALLPQQLAYNRSPNRTGNDSEPPSTISKSSSSERDNFRLVLYLDDNYPVIFLNHYFNEICSLHVLFDYTENPFRYLVERYLPTSTLIYNCVISMSAAYLLQTNDKIIHVAIRYHSDAMKCLSQSIEKLEASIASSPTTDDEKYSPWFEEVLFASIILGISSPWSDPGNLGTPHLLGARKICQRWLEVLVVEEPGELLETIQTPERSFLLGSMAYWEAFMSFVFDQPLNAVDYLLPFLQEPRQVVPHPYTAISTPIFINLARLGICVRQQRAVRKFENLRWHGKATGDALDEVLRVVCEVERFAVTYKIPSDQVFEDYKISKDTLEHFISFGRLYQVATLIELYTSFPRDTCGNHCTNDETDQYTDTPSSLSLTRCHSSRSVNLTQNCRSHRKKLITDLVTTFSTILEELPLEGPSNLYQTLALLIYSSSLHNLSMDTNTDANNSTKTLHETLQTQLLLIQMSDRQIQRARRHVKKKISVNCGYKGIQPVFKRALKLVEEIWLYLDSCDDNSVLGDSNIETEHWIDIMIQKKLETMFG